jgi:hypothetical protein
MRNGQLARHRPERQPAALQRRGSLPVRGGAAEILGPSVVPLRGGMAGTYLATTGEAGRAVLHCRMEGALDTEAVLTVRSREEQNV